MNIYIDALKSEPIWLLALLFIVAFVEAFALIGVVVPGIVLLFALSMAIGLEPELFFSAWLVASLGAFCGDTISFWLGRRWQPSPKASRYADLIDRAKDLFHRHGGKTIFIGRFIGPVRPVIPLVGGMLGVHWSQFLRFAIPACVLWAPVYLLPGMIFGASVELAAAMAGRLAVVMVILVMGIWLALWLVRVIYGITTRKSAWWMKRLAQWSQRHPILGRYVGDLLRPGSREVTAIALLGLVLAFSLTALLVFLIAAPAWLPYWSEAFHPATWASSLRNQWTDPVMVVLSLIGDVKLMAVWSLLATGILLLSGRRLAAGHWLVLLIGAWTLAFGIDAGMGWVIDRPSPEAIAHASLMDLPHVGFSVMVAVSTFFAVMVAKDLSARARKWPYLVATGIVLAIGFAHFYLELASLLGLAAALALGLGWAALVGIGYRHRAQVREFSTRLVSLMLVVWLALSVVYVGQTAQTRLEASQVPMEQRTFAIDEWRDVQWRALPMTRSVFGPRQARSIDFQVAGELEQLRRALESEGWKQVPTLHWSSVLRGLSGRPIHWPRALNGRSEALFMERVLEDGRTTEVIRLWLSGVSVIDAGDEAPVWVGQVRRVVIDSGVLGIRRWEDVSGLSPIHALETTLRDHPFIRVDPLLTEPTP